MPRFYGTAVLSILLLAFCAGSKAQETLSPERNTPAALEFFENRIRPLLAENCFECHGPEEQEGDLRLDHISTILEGGEIGVVVVPGDPEKSFLVKGIRRLDPDFEMPPESALPAEAIADLIAWIEMGLPWPDEPLPDQAAEEEVFDLEARKKSHWAWQPIVRPEIPRPNDAAWPRTNIDRFILRSLEAKGLAPAPRASKRALVRRASFDLIGLPPTPEEVDAFLADTSDAAFGNLVDRLLESPHFGERWGRHWLDLVRFAETYGHEADYPIRHMWKYRDYVIRALNADVPYDQFLTEHIAGDLLKNPRIHPSKHFNESIIGTGFWFMHQATHGPVDARQDFSDRVDNQIDVFGKAFLGMTVACARCHAHKFDAISTEDYYGLAGFLYSSRQQYAFLDPKGEVAGFVKKLKGLHAEGEGRMSKVMESFSEGAGARIADYLLAAQEAAQGNWQPDDGLDADRLDRWIDALEDPRAARTSHPFYAWVSATKGGSDLEDADEFEAGRVRLQADAAAASKEDASEKTYEVYEEFSGPSFRGWFETGEAFGGEPTGSGDWLPIGAPLQIAPAGVAHSGRLSRKLQGVLRSQSFTIEHNNIHYRMAGKNAQIRLIIEQFQLAEHNPLLFETTLVGVDTGGRFVWHNQTNLLSKYKGRSAYIEIIDNGDGWVAVDEIRFSDEAPAPEPATSITGAVAQPPDLSSLAKAFQNQAADAAKRWLRGAATPDETELLRWLIGKNLLETSEAAREVAAVVLQKALVAAGAPRPDRVLAIADGTPVDQHVFIRGGHKNLGDQVPRRFLEALAGKDQAPIGSGSGRRELANRLLDGSNPLPARVMANRVWHHLFGRGIVASVDNFGLTGQAPSHPELLDYLAGRFQENGWSLKKLIRSIMASSTYQMSSIPAGAMAEAKDPANVLLHRMQVRRLEGEAIRDSILAVAGTLDRAMYGPSIPTYLSEFMTTSRRPSESGPMDGDLRRTVYIRVQRNFLQPMQLAFDFPLPDSTAGRRTTSNIPAQALILMNDPFIESQAKAWGEAVAQDFAKNAEERVRGLYLRALGRPVAPAELDVMLNFINEQGDAYGLAEDKRASDPRVWSDVCHVMFTLKEFIFVG